MLVKFEENRMVQTTRNFELLTKTLILIGSAMFGATFNLVTRVELMQFLEH